MQAPSVDLTAQPDDLPKSSQWLLALVITIAVILTHGRSLRGEYLVDDYECIVTNRSIQSLRALDAVLAGGEHTTVIGRPVLNLSLALNYAIGGIRPEGFRIVNYGIHIAAAMVLFSLVRRCVATFPTIQHASTTLAFSISLLWSLHPLTINGVSYIVQRGESMASVCYLMALWGFVNGVQTSHRRWFVASVLAAWIGSFTKEIIATVPIAAIALDVLIVTRNWRTAVKRHGFVYLGLMTSWLPLAYNMYVSKQRDGTVGFAMGLALGDHVQTQVWAVAQYLRLTVWPYPLIFDYGPGFVVTDTQVVALAAGIVSAFLLTLAWFLFRKPALAFPGIAMGLLLLPTTVIPIVTQTVAEHRMYLASAGVVTWAVLWMWTVTKSIGHRWHWTMENHAAAWGMLLILCGGCLATVTSRHTAILLTAQSMWRDTIQKQPRNARAFVSLALEMSDTNTNLPEARRLCDQAVAIGGYFSVVSHEARAVVLRKLGESELALDDVKRASELSPKAINLHLLSAELLRELGRHNEALQELQKARDIDPRNASVDLQQGLVHLAQEDLSLAVQYFSNVLERQPNHATARRRLVAIYVRQQRWKEAMREIQYLQEAGSTIDAKLVMQVEQQITKPTATSKGRGS